MKAGIERRSERLNQNELRSEFVPLFTHAKETIAFYLSRERDLRQQRRGSRHFAVGRIQTDVKLCAEWRLLVSCKTR